MNCSRYLATGQHVLDEDFLGVCLVGRGFRDSYGITATATVALSTPLRNVKA